MINIETEQREHKSLKRNVYHVMAPNDYSYKKSKDPILEIGYIVRCFTPALGYYWTYQSTRNWKYSMTDLHEIQQKMEELLKIKQN